MSDFEVDSGPEYQGSEGEEQEDSGDDSPSSPSSEGESEVEEVEGPPPERPTSGEIVLRNSIEIEHLYQDAETAEDLRAFGREALSSVLKQEKNRTLLEKTLWNATIRVAKARQLECHFSSERFRQLYAEGILNLSGLIREKRPLKDLLQNLKAGFWGWEDPQTYHQFHHERKVDADALTQPPEVEEGLYECKCGSRKTISISVQTRSADEGMTVKIRCVTCGHRWTER